MPGRSRTRRQFDPSRRSCLSPGRTGTASVAASEPGRFIRHPLLRACALVIARVRLRIRLFVPVCTLLLALPMHAIAQDRDPLPTQIAVPDLSGPEALSVLLERPLPEADVQEEALALLEEGMEVWRDGDEGRGAGLVDDALSRLPSLADWRPLVRAELLTPTGDTAAVRAALAQLDRSGEYWLRWGWSFLAESLEEAEDPGRARAVARDVAESVDRADRAAVAWLRSGDLALEMGDTATARRDLWSAVDLGLGNPASVTAARVLDRLPPGSGGGAPGEPAREEDLLIGRALLAAGSGSRALERLAPLLETGEIPEEERDEIRVALGRALVQSGRPADAAETLAPVIASDAASAEAVAEALYWRAVGALSRGSVARAEADFLRLAEQHPETYWAERGLSILLDRELETGFGPIARGLLEELIEVGAGGSDASRQIVQLATLTYLRGDFTDAAELFRRHLDRTESTSGRRQATYWAALSLDRAGAEDEARALLELLHREDPLGFYGLLAGERLGAAVLPEGVPEGPPGTPALDAQLANALLRLRVHTLVPTSGSFAFELARLTEEFDRIQGGAYEFAEALIEGGFPLQGIVLGREIRDREEGWNLRLLRIVHPFPHRDAIVREARARGLDPFFVAGTIRQESMFDAEIRSSAGAVGLMQLLPSTAREVARAIGIRYSEEALTDPEINARLGTEFLAELVRQFDGRLEDALSAYNAGPSRIVRWRRDPTYLDADVFVEHIPFGETRDYVKRVNQYRRIYSALYGCGDFQPCLGLTYPEVVARSLIGGGAPASGLGRE